MNAGLRTVRSAAAVRTEPVEQAQKRWGRGGIWLIGLLYAALALVELWSPVAHSGWYTPGDVGQEFPITANPHAEPPVRNPIQGDPYTQIDPDLKLDISSVRSGHLPIWNTLNGNGEPLLGGLVAAPFSPFTVPFYILSFRVALIVSAGAKLWFLAFFTFLWLRRLLRRDVSAAVGGLLFAFAGFQIIWLNWQVQVASAVALPVALWCVQAALDELVEHQRGVGGVGRASHRLKIYLVCGSAAMATAILGGHPEVAIFDTVTVAIFAVGSGIVRLGYGRKFIRWLLGFGISLVLGLGITAMAILPFLQYEGVSSRTAYIDSAPKTTTAALRWSTTPLVAFPNLFGSPSTKYDDAAFDTQEGSNYAELDGNFVGLIALCLAPLSLLALFSRGRRIVSGFGLALLSVGTALLYTDWGARIWSAVPVVGHAVVNRSQDIQIMGVVTCAAVGVDWVISEVKEGFFRRWQARVAVAAASFLVVGVGACLGARTLRRHVEADGGGAVTASGSRFVRGQVELEVACVLIAFVALAIMAGIRYRWARTGSAIVLLGASAVSVITPLISWNPTVPRSEAYPVTADVAALKSVAGTSTTMYVNLVFPLAMTNAWFGLPDVGSYDALGVVWRDDLYDRAFGVAPTALGAGNSRQEVMPECLGVLQLFGVQHVIGGTGVFGDTSKLQPHLVRTDQPYPYYDVPGSSLVSVVGRSSEVRGDATALSKVSSCGFRPDSEVLIDEGAFKVGASGSPSATFGSALDGASAKVVKRSSTTLTVRTEEAKSGWLVIRQTWFPGWTAKVDGKPVALKRADVAFQAVRVPAGQHMVTLRYRSAPITTGLKITGASILVILVILGSTLADRRRRERPAPLHRRP